MPNNDTNSDTLRDSFVRRYQDYSVHKTVHINVEQIDSCIQQMKGFTAAAVPPPFRLGGPALCGSHPLVTTY